VYFAEEQNVYAPMMWYNVDEEPHVSDLKKFQWRGTSTSKGTFYHLNMDERMSALLYMYSNMEEMEPYFMWVFLLPHNIFAMDPYSITYLSYSKFDEES
jgi:hypothetical protein